ncbi:hypothetical protein NDU88_005213 [Pleurodeles waltl]|uniref:Uncharacterized protein n=1 Tax=Pleurodeles waltl TaxID=8319 RepID=A0AAV7QH81_PLEWA|nr:hypothetical protein NDU88_005213 [Pleurodeles waltl]
MAPKASRNLGDKSEGAKTTRTGRDKGESAGLNKRLTSTTGKAAGKNTSGLMKDAKMSDSTTSLLEIKLKEIQDINRETREKVLGLPGNGQLQIQQTDQSKQLDYQNKGKTGSPLGPTAEEDDSTNLSGSPKKWNKIMGGKNPQLTDWGNDSSDKFYSLTEESDLGSADCSFSETDESETSEAGNKSPSGEFTVRKVRQRKFVKSRSGSQEGSENTASMSGRTLRWDYSGIGLADTPTVGKKGPANDKNESDLGASAGGIGNSGNTHAMGTEAGILQSIYSSIKELQTETRIESRQARVATKRLQGSVRKCEVVKGLKGAFVYQDDILVYDKDHEEHMARLDVVLAALEEKGLN